MHNSNTAATAQAASSTTERNEALLGEIRDVRDAESLAVWAAGFLMEKIVDLDRRLRVVEATLLPTQVVSCNCARLGDH